MLRLVGHVHEFGHRRLHSERHLVRGDAGFDFRIAHSFIAVAVEFLDRFDEGSLLSEIDSARTADIVDRVARRAELNALVAARQEAGSPLTRRNRLRVAAADTRQHNEAGQVVGLAAQAVVDPRTHARPAVDRRAGIHERVSRVVINLLGQHRPDDADVVGHLRVPRQKVADQLPALAILFKLRQVALNFKDRVLKLSDRLALRERCGHRLPVHFVEFWFVIERLQMRRSSGHTEEDDAFGFRLKVRQPGLTRNAGHLRVCSRRVSLKERGQCRCAKPD